MSRAFLDSHVAYWLARDGRFVSPRALDAINQHSVRIVSSMTFAEFEIKAMLGKKIEITDLHEKFTAMGIEVEPFDYSASRSIARFQSLIDHDPFDRMIFAQAAARPGTTFYTADAVLLELGLDWVVDARA